MKGEPAPEIYKLKKELLTKLMGLEDQEQIDLFFSDETGFSLTPSIPYGWIPTGEDRTIRSEHKKVCNFLGFLSRKGKLKVFSTPQNINSDFVIECFDEIAEDLKKPTVLVLDNAPWHVSQKVKDKEQEWNEKNLYLFYLPVYSPHLNLIENLWRKIKYEWLKAKDYLSAESLKEALFNIVEQYDNEFSINLSMNFFK